MTEKYPYLSKVLFDGKRCLHENKEEIKKDPSLNCSCSSSDLNVDDHLPDIDLECLENGELDFRNILSWQIETNSMDISDVLDVDSTHICAQVCLEPSSREIKCASSFSSWSSLASSNDISYSKSQINKSSLQLPPQILNPDQINKLSNPSISTTIISQFSTFFLGKFKSSNNSTSTPLKSTTCLILNERPSGLPAKSPDEMRQHKAQYNQLINSIKRKEQRQHHRDKVKQKSKLNFEERQIQLANIWRNFIIPNWSHQKNSNYVRHIWWEGIPTSLRDKVWKLCIPNTLRLTKVHYDNFLSQMKERVERYCEMQKKESTLESKADVPSSTDGEPRLRNGHIPTASESRSSAYDLYISETVNIHNQRSSSHSSSGNTKMSRHRGSESSSSETEMRQTLLNTIKLDVSRTFPHLNLFQNGGPHYDLLYQLLGSYACYRPDIGYVQGMSFLAAILILVMNVEDAFISFANIIEMPCHHALYGVDEIEFTVYVESFKLLLLTHLPQLGHHFVKNRLDVNIFLCDWLFTIYSRALSLETTLMVWDMFCRDGESALFRAGLGILRCYEMQLLNSDFEDMASFLTSQMPESLTPPVLVEEMQEILLCQTKFAETLEEGIPVDVSAFRDIPCTVEFTLYTFRPVIVAASLPAATPDVYAKDGFTNTFM